MDHNLRRSALIRGSLKSVSYLIVGTMPIDYRLFYRPRVKGDFVNAPGCTT